MSGITGIGGNTSDLYNTLLQQAISQQDKSVVDSNAATDSQTTQSSTTDTTNTDSQNSNTLKDKIRIAIMSAMQKAEQAGNTSNLLTVISAAVNQTLKDAGIDTTSLNQNNNVDSSTKNLVSVLDNLASTQSETDSLLSMLDSQTSTDSGSDLFSLFGDQSGTNSANNDPLSLLGGQDLNSQQSQNVLGYLLDTQQ